MPRRIESVNEPSAATRQLAELLRLDPAALREWGGITRQFVKHKADIGLAHWTDRQVVDDAPRIFHSLIVIVLQAHQDERLAHRLLGLEWFTSSCAALAEGAAPPPLDG